MAQTGTEFVILVSLSSWCWDYWHAPSNDKAIYIHISVFPFAPVFSIYKLPVQKWKSDKALKVA